MYTTQFKHPNFLKMKTTRRSFLKKQLILGSSVILASSVDGLAMVSKSINVAGGSNSLNLLCTSDLTQLGNYRHTIKNFELSSINLFAGNMSDATQNTLYQLGRVNYHAVNFSLDKRGVNLATMLSEIHTSDINFVNCNYRFENETTRHRVLPYVIIYSGKIKIGITGVGAQTNTEGITVEPPIAALNKIAKYLKSTENCDKVICLADLGFNKKDKLNNLLLAQASANVDFVIGAGENPLQATTWIYRGVDNQEVIICANNQVDRYTNLVQITGNNNNRLFNFNTKNI